MVVPCGEEKSRVELLARAKLFVLDLIALSRPAFCPLPLLLGGKRPTGSEMRWLAAGKGVNVHPYSFSSFFVW